MSDIEEKKWLISRIDLYYKLGIDGFQADQKKHESYLDKGILKIHGIRNNILTGIGVIVTTLVGITTFFNLEPFLIPLLGIAGLASVITVMIFNLSTKWIEDVSLSYMEMYEGNIGTLTFSQGFLTTRVARLSEVTFEYMYNFYIFTLTLVSAIQLDNAKTLRSLAEKHAKLSSFKSEVETEAKSLEEYADLISVFYPKINRSFDVPSELLDFVDQVYKNYKSK